MNKRKINKEGIAINENLKTGKMLGIVGFFQESLVVIRNGQFKCVINVLEILHHLAH